MAADARDLEALEIALEPRSIGERPLASGCFGSVHRARFVPLSRCAVPWMRLTHRGPSTRYAGMDVVLKQISYEGMNFAGRRKVEEACMKEASIMKWLR